MNNKMFLICGYAATGKTASLRTIENQEDWIYFSTEGGPKSNLPFKDKFDKQIISDPMDMIGIIEDAIEVNKDPNNKPYAGIIIDSLDFLMNQFESKYCIGVQDTRAGWQAYQQYFKTLMQDVLIRWGKPVICIAHLQTDMQDETNVMVSHAPVKGALKGLMMEAFFNIVVYARKVTPAELKPYKNDLLNITEREDLVGVKYVFQTQPTKLDHNNTIRGPMDLFSVKETFIDNDCQKFINKLNDYYGD